MVTHRFLLLNLSYIKVFSSIPGLLKSFYESVNLSGEMLRILSFNLLMWHVIMVDFLMLNHSNFQDK